MTSMNPQWDSSVPLDRQLRDRVVATILEGQVKDGDPLPSVRSLAAAYQVSPLTVLKAYQWLVDERLAERRRGHGIHVSEGARRSLTKNRGE